jgi:hypothetical protein
MKLFACILCLSCFVLPCQADDRPAAGVPELEPLAHYVGEWDVRITGGNNGVTEGETTGQWILGGRFVEQQGVLTSADGSRRIEVKTIYTFDQQSQTYRSWTFLASGYTVERTGMWDADAQIFTFAGSNNDVESRQVSDFSKPGEVTWSITSTAADGTETLVNAGVSTAKE